MRVLEPERVVRRVILPELLLSLETIRPQRVAVHRVGLAALLGIGIVLVNRSVVILLLCVIAGRKRGRRIIMRRIERGRLVVSKEATEKSHGRSPL